MTPAEVARRDRNAALVTAYRNRERTRTYYQVRAICRALTYPLGAFVILGAIWLVFVILGLLA